MNADINEYFIFKIPKDNSNIYTNYSKLSLNPESFNIFFYKVCIRLRKPQVSFSATCCASRTVNTD